MLTVHREVLTGVSKAASKEPSRYALTGVLVEDRGKNRGKKGGRVTGTDGKFLVRATFANAVDPKDLPEAVYKAVEGKNGGASIIAGAKELAVAIRVIPRPGKRTLPCLVPVVLGVGPEGDEIPRLTLAGTNDPGTASVSAVTATEGSYPKCDEVIPKAGSAPEMVFDAVILRNALDAIIEAAGTNKDGKVPVRVRYHGPLDATTVTASSRERKVGVIGLVMPFQVPK